MKNNSFIKNHTDEIGTGIAVFAAIIFVYLTFPSVAEHLLPNAKENLWASPISAEQGMSGFFIMVLISVGFMIVNRARYLRATGDSFIPIWMIALGMGLIAVVVTAIAAVFIFGVASGAILSLGVESGLAITLGFIVTLIVFALIR